ncbi:T9SS type A sorting domain-containing protein [uncultured Psychroserpens sp.]|uniref:T9SS type A sorting domain-containing protein n=1 Tax=uncultured Psychroserpens sp. TaxID=255436 RepID=UPI00261101EA|nr:T9SS type A sorting domain-containing protein [uncultured Psychroserpens sp.]
MMTKKLLLSFFIFVSMSSMVFGQIVFQETVIDSTNAIGLSTSNPLSATYILEASYSADIDNDGDDDLIPYALPLKWMENTDGLGSFDAEHIIETNLISLNALTFADVDNDGDIDVLSSERTELEGFIVWYENTNGLGVFGTRHIILNDINTPSRLEVADVDGDTDLDLISVSLDGKIAWYENTDGLGAFGAQQLIAFASSGPTTQYIEIRAEDFDGDMDNDLIFASNGSPDEKGYLLENTDGLGTFSSPQEIFDIFGGLFFVRTADLDNDGDMDLFGLNTWDGLVAYRNDGSGNFTGYGNAFNSTYDGFIGFAQALDIDNDNDEDLVAFVKDEDDTNIGALVLFENTDGQGTFSAEQVISSINFTKPGFRFNIADFNADGYDDLVCFYLDGYEFSWNQNMSGSGSFGPSQEIINDLKGVRSVISADIDNDGDTDIIFAADDHNKIGWYENTGVFGDFESQKILSANSFGANNVIAKDIDGDDFLDLVVSSTIDNKIEWLQNDGFGNFTSQVPISTTSESVDRIMVADLDGDNDMDIIELELVGNHIAWYENLDGQGSFGTEQIIVGNIDDARDFDIGDIDNDGDLDLIFNEPLSWVMNDGLGNFGAPQTFVSTNDGTVILADLDNDSDLDVLTSDPFGWYENEDGVGGFGVFQLLDDQSLSTDHMMVLDIDADGDLDIINTYATSLDNEDINLYKNYSGVFTEAINIGETDQRISSIFSEDIDANGLIDIIYSTKSTSDNGKIAWYRNLGILTNQISGTITYDSDSDGCGPSDNGISNIWVGSGGAGASFITFTNPDGTFATTVNQGDFTTVLSPSLPSYFTVSPPLYFSSFDGENQVDSGANFCVAPNASANDLNVSLYPVGEPRPGFDSTYELVYNNIGTTTLSGAVTLTYDASKMQLVSTSESPTTQSSGNLSFDYSNLTPFESRSISIILNVFAPPVTNIGDVLVSTASINPIANDVTENDNTFVLEETVIGAYDPNDISVLEGDQILLDQADDYLHYIIRFQNTGNAEAINVEVTNIIDPKLDVLTMQVESLSHSGRIEIEDTILARFVFENIGLPGVSQDEAGSIGYIAYKIKPKAGAMVGDVFTNDAAIFFDFNPPIFTNTVNTEVVDALSVADVDIQDVVLFPNPSLDIVNIKSVAPIDAIVITDINGRQIKVLTTTNEFSVVDLSKGIYFVKIKSGNSSIVKKLIKN